MAHKTKYFMSDDAEAYSNAWAIVMGHPEKRLLCRRHVQKNWRNNVNNIEVSENKKLVQGILDNHAVQR